MTIDDFQHSKALKTGKQNDRNLSLAFAFVTISLASGLVYGWPALRRLLVEEGTVLTGIFFLCLFMLTIRTFLEVLPRFQLRKQQQRLLLLRHSARCKALDGECKATPCCEEMKRVWSHMARCEEDNCRIQHCYSSRMILRHYRKCKDQVCLICEPVRRETAKSRRRLAECSTTV